MKPKIYMLSFDPLKANPLTLHNIITTMPHKKDWWHYLAPTYLIVSDSTALEIQAYINSRWQGNFLIVEINANNSGGWLPVDAWQWINDRR